MLVVTFMGDTCIKAHPELVRWKVDWTKVLNVSEAFCRHVWCF